MVSKFLNYFSLGVVILSCVGSEGICGAKENKEKTVRDCLYKYTEHYCSQSQDKFTEALEKCKEYESLLAKGCIHAGLKKGFKVPDALKTRYPLFVEAVQVDQNESDAEKEKRPKQSQQFIAKENLIARCRAVGKGITSMLTRNGMSTASHPLILQVQKLLAELVAAPQVDALLLLHAGQCDGIGDAALALLPDTSPQSGGKTPCLRPPSHRRSPIITDDPKLSEKGATPSSPLSEPDTRDKVAGVEPTEKVSSSPAGVYASGQLPSVAQEKELLP